MAIDTGLIHEFALGEGDRYAAKLASILNNADGAFTDADNEAVIERPGL